MLIGRSDSETPDDMAKNSHFKDLQQLGPLEVLRADLDVEGSFDDAVAGCDYAFLVAAPVNIDAKNPEVRRRRSTIMYFRFVLCLVTAFIHNFHPLIAWVLAERADRARCQGNSERGAVVREGWDGEARGPDLVGGRGRQQAGAARRRARAGGGLLVQRRAPHRHQVSLLGTRARTHTHARGGSSSPCSETECAAAC